MELIYTLTNSVTGKKHYLFILKTITQIYERKITLSSCILYLESSITADKQIYKLFGTY